MSFDNLNSNNSGTDKRVSLLFMVFLTVAASSAAVFIPFLNFAAFSFVPVPATLLVSLKRIKDAVICAVAGAAVFLFFNYVMAAVIFIIISGLAFGYRYFRLRKVKPYFMIGAVFLFFLAAVLLFFLINSAIIQKNYFSESVNFYNSYVNGIEKDPLIQNYRNFIVADESQFNDILDATRSFLNFLPKIIPGMLVLFFGFSSILNYVFTGIFMKKYSLELDLLPSFKEWDLPWAWCWGVIAGIILIIVPSFNTGNSMFFYAIGSNLLIVFGSVYLVLGLSVLWGIFERFNLKNSMKIIIIAAIFLFFGLFIFLPVLGLADIWINFRRLKRVQK